MTQYEQFIKDCTRTCSNKLADDGYHEWLTPDQALRACEITIEQACEWLRDNLTQHYAEEPIAHKMDRPIGGYVLLYEGLIYDLIEHFKQDFHNQ